VLHKTCAIYEEKEKTMSDNLNVDNSNSEDAAGTPNQTVPSGENGSIKDADQLAKILDAKLAEALKPVLAEVRGVQGRQDKDRKGFQEFLDEYRKQKAKGLSDTDAENAAEHSLKEKAETQSDKLLLRQIADKLGLSSFAGTPLIQKLWQTYSVRPTQRMLS
jgi:hypothetical protein